MQATINDLSIIHCDRIMYWYNKDDEESKSLIMESDEQTLIPHYTRCCTDQKGIGGKQLHPHTKQSWALSQTITTQHSTTPHHTMSHNKQIKNKEEHKYPTFSVLNKEQASRHWDILGCRSWLCYLTDCYLWLQVQRACDANPCSHLQGVDTKTSLAELF